jgi:fumarate reductase subunit D
VGQKKAWVGKPESREKERKLNDLNRKIQEREQLMQLEHDREREMVRQDTAICDKAIVLLSSERQKNSLIAEVAKVEDYVLLEHFGVEGLEVTVQRAPEPKEIIWENINYPNAVRMVRLWFGWVLTVLLLGVVTAIFYFLFHAKSQAVDSMGSEMAAGITILVMVLITFFNKFCISYLLHHITDLEMHRTGSEFEYSFGLKYTMGLFFTTAIMTLVVEGFGLHNFYS